ncbi:MAG: PAS domain S-box protein [Deltaproteobacteria bacterium]|nr:PAS domain S-box protein [Deltaproteobacteria bacterium]
MRTSLAKKNKDIGVPSDINVLLICPEKSLNVYLDSILTPQDSGNISIKLKHMGQFEKALAYLTTHGVDLILFEVPGTEDFKTALPKIEQFEHSTPVMVVHENKNQNFLKKIIKRSNIDLVLKNKPNLDQINYLIIQTLCAHYLEESHKTVAPDTHTLKQTNSKKRKPALQNNIQTEEHFKNIINKSVETIIVVNSNNVVQYTNESIQKLLGWSAEKITGRPLIIPVTRLGSKHHTDAPKNLNVPIIELLACTNKILEVAINNPRGDERILHIRSSGILWNNQHCYLIALHDITEIKRVAILTAEINEKSRTDRLKDEFVSIVSHELRTPLTIIKGAINNLREGIVGPVSDKQALVLDTTLKNVNRLTRIINDLLDLSRLESGRVNIQRRKIDIVPVIHSIVQIFSETAREKSISFVCEIPKILPPVFADSDMVEQVLTNLIQNAMRYAKKTITIQVINENLTQKSPTDFKPNTEMIRVGVIDDGPGIAKEHLHLLFNKFEQINRPMGGGGYKGTGLGLTICKQIVNLHNGKIWIDSDIGKGSKFFFLLPQYHENDDFIAGLETIINKAEKNNTSLGILVTRILNLTEILQESTEQELATMISSISREFRNETLRKTDFCHFKRDTKEFIIILVDTNRNTTNEIGKRICNTSHKFFCAGKSGKIYAKLMTGMAIYPDDHKEPDRLLEKAYQGLAKCQE